MQVVLFVFVGFIGGGVITAGANPMYGVAWITAWGLLSLVIGVDDITTLLKKQQQHNDWLQKIENYRFDHDHPDAAEITAERERERKAAIARQQAHAELAAQQAKEAKRRAKEPTFVATETVPDVPADFKPAKKRAAVDFSAIDEASQPRRKKA